MSEFYIIEPIKKGPWTILTDFWNDVVRDENGAMVCKIPPLARNKSNASLIVAAPDLLERCISVSNALKVYRYEFARTDEHLRTVLNTLIHELDEAILKARGES